MCCAHRWVAEHRKGWQTYHWGRGFSFVCFLLGKSERRSCLSPPPPFRWKIKIREASRVQPWCRPLTTRCETLSHKPNPKKRSRKTNEKYKVQGRQSGISRHCKSHTHTHTLSLSLFFFVFLFMSGCKNGRLKRRSLSLVLLTYLRHHFCVRYFTLSRLNNNRRELCSLPLWWRPIYPNFASFFLYFFYLVAALNDAILLVTQELKVVRTFVSGIHFVLPFFYLFWIHLTWNRGPSSPMVETDAGTCMILLLFQAPFQEGLEPI